MGTLPKPGPGSRRQGTGLSDDVRLGVRSGEEQEYHVTHPSPVFQTCVYTHTSYLELTMGHRGKAMPISPSLRDRSPGKPGAVTRKVGDPLSQVSGFRRPEFQSWHCPDSVRPWPSHFASLILFLSLKHSHYISESLRRFNKTEHEVFRTVPDTVPDPVPHP